MATKIINTRIKNRADDLSAWLDDGVELLSGEIAIVRVQTGETYKNPVTGAIEPVVELLMKVGDGVKSFEELPWLSAKASDVYDWAKKPTINEVEVSTVSGSNKVTKPLSGWAGDIKSLEATVATHSTTLNGSDTTEGSIAKKLKDKIAELAYEDSAKAGNFVTVVSQENGKINVTRKSISAGELPYGISSAKISVSGFGTITALDKLLEDFNTRISSAGTGAVNTLNYTKDQATTDEDTDTTKFVTQVTQSNGQIAVKNRSIVLNDLPTITGTKINTNAISAAKIAADAVTTAKIKDGNVTDAKIESVSADKVIVTPPVGETSAETLQARLNTVRTELASIRSALTGSTFFRGEAKAAPTNIREIEIKSGTDKLIANPGDIVLFGEKEFICTAIDDAKANNEADSATWIELGDLTRVGVLETLLEKLAGTATANQYVTNFTTNADNQLVPVSKQIEAKEIKYGTGSDTVATVLSSHTLSINNFDAITADMLEPTLPAEINLRLADHLSTYVNHTPPSASVNFDPVNDAIVTAVGQVSGIVESVRKVIPVASSADYGLVKTSASTSSNSDATVATSKAVYNVNQTVNGLTAQLGGIATGYNTLCARVKTIDELDYLVPGNSESLEDMIIFDCGGAGIMPIKASGLLDGASFVEVFLSGNSPYIRSTPFNINEPGKYKLTINLRAGVDNTMIGGCYLSSKDWQATEAPTFMDNGILRDGNTLSCMFNVTVACYSHCLFIFAPAAEINSTVFGTEVSDIASISLVKVDEDYSDVELSGLLSGTTLEDVLLNGRYTRSSVFVVPEAGEYKLSASGKNIQGTGFYLSSQGWYADQAPTYTSSPEVNTASLKEYSFVLKANESLCLFFDSPGLTNAEITSISLVKEPSNLLAGVAFADSTLNGTSFICSDIITLSEPGLYVLDCATSSDTCIGNAYLSDPDWANNAAPWAISDTLSISETSSKLLFKVSAAITNKPLRLFMRSNSTSLTSDYIGQVKLFNTNDLTPDYELSGADFADVTLSGSNYIKSAPLSALEGNYNYYVVDATFNKSLALTGPLNSSFYVTDDSWQANQAPGFTLNAFDLTATHVCAYGFIDFTDATHSLFIPAVFGITADMIDKVTFTKV